MSAAERPPRLFRPSWAVVWLAGRIVPAHQRNEWYGRWRHTIWHWAAFLEESGRITPSNQRELLTHCWNSFADAFWTRFDRDRFLHRANHTVRAPGFCLSILGVALLGVVIGSSFLARTRQLLLPMPVASPARVGNVQYVGSWWSALVSAVPADWVRTWRQHSQSVSGAAEFALEQRVVRGYRFQTQAGVARVSADFFDVTGGSPAVGRLFRSNDAVCECVVVSYAFWRNKLLGDANVIGQSVDVEGEVLRIIGVAPRRYWLPASGVSLWRPVQFRSPNPRIGDLWPVGAVVRVKDGIALADADRELEDTVRHYGLGNPTGRAWPGGAIQIVPFQSQARQNAGLYGVVLLVSLFAAVVMGVWRYHPNRAAITLRWTAFLVGKTLLVLLVCTLGSIELAPALTRVAGHVFDNSLSALSLWLCLAASVAALLWALFDQQQRCPICFSRLELPVQVGEPSRMLFGFGATEFVCSRGHGLLHISDSHCSWIDPEEWTGLDASWQNLFDDAPKDE